MTVRCAQASSSAIGIAVDVGDQPELHRGSLSGRSGGREAGGGGERPGECRQLGRAVSRRLDGVHQGGAEAAALQGMQAGDRRAARRGHLVLEHAGMLAGIADHHGGAQHGLGGQECGHVSRQADADPAVAECLDHQVDEGRPAPRQAGHRVEQTIRGRGPRGRPSRGSLSRSPHPRDGSVAPSHRPRPPRPARPAYWASPGRAGRSGPVLRRSRRSWSPPRSR